ARRSSTRRESSILFSSRRRHTRFKCDWSSDVCSSDLITHTNKHTHTRTHKNTHTHKHTHSPDQIHHIPQQWRLGERSSEAPTVWSRRLVQSTLSRCFSERRG